MVGMQSWLVSWLTRPSLQTQHQRHRLFQNKRVLEVLFYWTHRILLVSRFFLCISLNLHYLCSDYEKNRNEKMRNMENPFKFGTIVEEEYFTDRVEEVAYIEQADYRDGSNEHFFKEIF